MFNEPKATLRSWLIWAVGIAVLLAWTAGWALFSSQLHTGWLAVRMSDGEGGSMPVSDMIAGVMILLGWLFGLGGIGILTSGKK